MNIFEIIMLVCFGLSWPTNIYKSLKARTAKGKSVFFLVIIEIGYISGIVNKIINSPDLVMGLYILNFCMIMVDIALYFRNRRLDRLRDAGQAV